MSEVKIHALIYKVKCDPRFDYDHAQPLCFTTQDFTCHVSAGRARFELATTCPTVEKAREIVDPFAESWTTKAELAHQPGTFKLIFHGAEIIDLCSSGSGSATHLMGLLWRLVRYDECSHIDR